MALVLRPAVVAELVLQAPSGPVDRATGTLGHLDGGRQVPSCSMRWPACCACSTGPPTRPSWRRSSSARSSGVLLTGPQGGTIRQIGLADSDLSHVSRAIGWIRDNYAEPMRIDDLARLSRDEPVGVSSALPRGDGHEPVAVSEAHPPAGGPLAARRPSRRRRGHRTRCQATTARRSSTVSTDDCSASHQDSTPSGCAWTGSRCGPRCWHDGRDARELVEPSYSQVRSL